MNQLRNFFTLLIIIGISFGQLQAQTTPAPPYALRTDLIPPSPNAASLGKYGLIPVSLQTGIPNISIPITEAIGQQLKVPITLAYHHAGFKPTEEASWVGLGWSLDAGGVITRIVKDKVDEFIADRGKYNNVNWRFNTIGAITNSFLDSAVFFGTVDTQPDVYAYNFAGYSGKFILYQGKVYQYPYQQLTIVGEPTTGFTITTPDGSQYKFYLTEQTVALTTHNLADLYGFTYSLPSTYNSSWYLQSIVAPDHKDQINFTYSGADVIAQSGPGIQNLKVQVLGTQIYTANPISFAYPVRTTTPRLVQITTSKMSVKFNAATSPRLDIASLPALGNIEIYNYQGKLLNRFTFNTSYFSPSNNATEDNTRLKLTGIDEGISAQNIKKTRFYYREINQFPSKRLPGVDHWGYTNGLDVASTGYLLPNTIFPLYGRNKNPDTSFSQNTVLRKIIYPTGGSTVFDYELNLTSNGLHYTMAPNTMEVDVPRQDTTTINTITNTGTFTLNVAQTVHIITSRRPKIPVGAAGSGNGPDDPTKDSTPKLVLSSGTQSYSFRIIRNKDNNGKLDSIALQPGTYLMTSQCDANENYVTAIVNYVTQTNQIVEGIPGPGLRIKTISDYTDPESLNPASTKQYIYKDSTGVSTGVLLNIPSYGGKNYAENDYSSTCPNFVISNYMTYTSTNGSGMNVSQDMYYSKVYERDVSPKDTLLSKSEFNTLDAFTENGASVFLTAKTDFRRSGNTYSKVRRQEFNYSLIEDSTFFAIRPYLSVKNISTAGFGCLVLDSLMRIYKYDLYTIEPSWLRLNSTKEINYYNTSDTVVTITKYTYDAIPRNRILATTTDSKGRWTVEKNKYRENYAVSVFTPGVASVVESQKWLKKAATDSVLVSGVITQYDPAFFKPKTIYGFESAGQVNSLNQETKNGSGLYTSLLSDSRYIPRLSNTFDGTTGNLTAQDLTNFSDGTVHQVAYLWGYHNNYPIAQVKNADLSAIAYTSFEDDDNSWSYTPASVVTTDAYTGVKSYTGTISKANLPAGNYSLGLWGKGTGTITVGGVSKTMNGKWAWYEWQLTNITGLSFNSNGNLIDEVRLIPANSLMSSYTYTPEAGVTSIVDTRGIPQFYEYDEVQRLKDIKDKDGNIVKYFDYNYAVQGPFWKDNGVTQCVQSNGINTGEQQMQQIDINPLSPTYNQNQWRSLGNTGSCPVPVPIYIQMTVAGAYSSSVSGNIHTFNSYSFKSYSDANCTIPLTLSSALTLNYLVTARQTFNDGSPATVITTAKTITLGAGTNNATSPSIDITGCNGSAAKGNCVTSVVSLQPGNGYTPYIPIN